MINLHKLKEYSLLLVGREKKKKLVRSFAIPSQTTPFLLSSKN